MKSNIAQIESVKYHPHNTGKYFRLRSYVGLEEKGQLDYDECFVTETWVFCSSKCPYIYLSTKNLYSTDEYPYPLNKYGDTKLNVGYWK